jgi:hypothetical protein
MTRVDLTGGLLLPMCGLDVAMHRLVIGSSILVNLFMPTLGRRASVGFYYHQIGQTCISWLNQHTLGMSGWLLAAGVVLPLCSSDTVMNMYMLTPHDVSAPTSGCAASGLRQWGACFLVG